MTHDDPTMTLPFAENGKPEYLVADLINTREKPWSVEMLKLSLSNIPIWDEVRGEFRRITRNERIYMVTDVVPAAATPEDCLRGDYQDLLSRYTDPHGQMPLEFQTNYEVMYCSHDVIQLKDLEPEFISGLGEDLRRLIETGQMDMINVSGEALPSKTRVQVVDLRGNPQFVSERDEQDRPLKVDGKIVLRKVQMRDIFGAGVLFDKELNLYRAVKDQEEWDQIQVWLSEHGTEDHLVDEPRMTNVRRKHKFFGDIQDIWEVFFNNRILKSPTGENGRFTKGKRFAGKIMRLKPGSNIDFEAAAFCTGVMPDNDCLYKLNKAARSRRSTNPETLLAPGKDGKGKIFFFHPMAFKWMRASEQTYHEYIYPVWLPFHPPPFPREDAPRRFVEAQRAALEGRKAPKALKGKKRREAEAAAAEEIAPAQSTAAPTDVGTASAPAPEPSEVQPA